MKKILSFFLIIQLSACSSFKETHYFKDTLNPVPNYYKVDIEGWTLMTSSRYVSGYYDRGAVQAYFGELGQPAKGSFPYAVKKDGKLDSICDENIQEKELVLLLSTNSDAIANSITNLVKSKSVANSLSTIINKDKIEEANDLTIALEINQRRIELYVAMVDSFLGINSDSTVSDEQIIRNLKQLVKRRILEKEGSLKEMPDDFNDLRELYYANE